MCINGCVNGCVVGASSIMMSVLTVKLVFINFPVLLFRLGSIVVFPLQGASTPNAAVADYFCHLTSGHIGFNFIGILVNSLKWGGPDLTNLCCPKQQQRKHCMTGFDMAYKNPGNCLQLKTSWHDLITKPRCVCITVLFDLSRSVRKYFGLVMFTRCQPKSNNHICI